MIPVRGTNKDFDGPCQCSRCVDYNFNPIMREQNLARQRELQLDVAIRRAQRQIDCDEKWAARRARWSARWLKNFGWGA